MGEDGLAEGVFKPQNQLVLSQRIYQDIRQAILDGTLQPGQRIIEANVARQMSVSRAPLREALSLLQREGLVVVKAHRETRVASFTLEEIEELHLVRATLETLAIQFASRRIQPEQLAEVEDLAQQMKEAAADRNHRLLMECDYAFHDVICGASGVKRLYDTWHTQHALLSFWLAAVARSDDDDMDAIADDHWKLLNALKSGDDSRIAEEVHYHIYESGPAYKKEREEWAAKFPWTSQSSEGQQ